MLTAPSPAERGPGKERPGLREDDVGRRPSIRVPELSLCPPLYKVCVCVCVGGVISQAAPSGCCEKWVGREILPSGECCAYKG